MNGRSLNVHRELTILQAAQQNNIDIPALCAHPSLTPMGGCRMCMVEIDGMPGYPTACTTRVADGMNIRTDTEKLKAERAEILQLILSEHPSSCLICDERVECASSMTTIRKAGVTSGCRYCPNDHQCELQDLVESLGIEKIKYPVLYRGFRVEKEDPFYDRDYNLCILCGRCVRICQEVRIASTLTFKQRGPHTVIGPAFNRTHLESDCEFCGACITVCPTGSLAEKTAKWEGKADKEVVTTCPLCGIGCQVRVLTNGDRVIGTRPAPDPLISDNQLCVKGRFSIGELVNGHTRLKLPYRRINGNVVPSGWKEAVKLAAERLSACPPERFGMLVSPDCSNEDLYIAQKFARTVMKSHHVDTSARLFYGSAFNAYLKLMQKCSPLSEIRRADAVFSIGLDPKFGGSVVGVEIRKALNAGAKLITLHPRVHHLHRVAHSWLKPQPGEETDLLDQMIEAVRSKNKSDNPEITQSVDMLKSAKSPVLIVGWDFLQSSSGAKFLQAVDRLADALKAKIVLLPVHGNLRGSILMGAYPELLPGGLPQHEPAWDSEKVLSDKRQVLYLIGETVHSTDPPADYIISQNIYPTEPAFDLMLPAAAFTETDGTMINGEGRLQRIRKAVDPPGNALPHWKILCRIAREMGAKGFDFDSVADVQKEMVKTIKGLKNLNDPERQASPLTAEVKLKPSANGTPAVSDTGPESAFILTVLTNEHCYHGMSLTDHVEGLRNLFIEEKLLIHPSDAEKAELMEEDEVVVSSPLFEESWPVRFSDKQVPGTLQALRPPGVNRKPGPFAVKIRKKDV